MSNAQLEAAIEAAWEARDTITPATTGEQREAIEDTLNALDGGSLRVAQKLESGDWHVNQWANQAVAAGKLSGGCTFAGQVGDDDDMRNLQKEMSANNVELQWKVRKDVTTGKAFIYVDENTG